MQRHADLGKRSFLLFCSSPNLNSFIVHSQDLYSFNVEQSRGDTQNLVFVVMKSVDGCDVQTAMNKIGQLIMHRLGDYLDDKANLPSWGPEIDDDVKRYCQGLEDWVIGSLQWSFQTERYFGRVVDQVRDDRTVTLLRRYTDDDAPAPEALADAVFVPTPLST